MSLPWIDAAEYVGALREAGDAILAIQARAITSTGMAWEGAVVAAALTC